MKVTITIDDTNPEIVAVFGKDSLTAVANDKGYQSMVPKTEEELPEKVEKQMEGIDGEMENYLDYPEGTELFKENSQTKGEYLGKLTTYKVVVPFLLENFKKNREVAKAKEVNDEFNMACGVLERAAVIEVIE